MSDLSVKTEVAQDLSFEIVTTCDRLRAIGEQWDELWWRADGGFTLMHPCVVQSFDRVGGPLGFAGGLRCVVGWEGDRIVVAWPLMVRRAGPWRVGRQVGPMAAESNEVLVEPGPRSAELAAAAWRAALAPGGIDLLRLSFVRSGSALDGVVRRLARPLTDDPDVTTRVELDGETDWDTFHRARSASERKTNRRRRRRLAERGEVVLEVVEAGTPRAPELVGWLLDHKAPWGRRVGKTGPWLFDEGYRGLWQTLLSDPEQRGRCLVFALQVDGATVAAQVAVVAGAHLDLVIAAFDDDLRELSPGTALGTEVVRWAVERGLDVELGAGGESYKLFWSRGASTGTHTWGVPVTRWGAVGVRAQQGVRRARAAVVAARAPAR